MTAIVWTTLITAVATVTGSLGAVWIKGRYDDRAQARQATENRTAARKDQQRQAYGELVKTARLALRNFRQLLLAYAVDTTDIPDVQEAFSQTASLAADMNQAAAIAELVGSPRGRQHARAIYEKAKACADLFQIRELTLAAVPRVMADAIADEMVGGKLIAGMIPGKLLGRMIRKQMGEVGDRLLSFDTEKASALCDELGVAIDDFIEAVNTELGQ